MAPMAPRRPCIVWPCPQFAVPGKARCAEHQRAHYQQANAARDPEVVAFYNSTAWKRVRAAYKAAHPLCEICAEAGREAPAQQVDHRIPLRERPDLALEESNLRSLCMPCHSRRTRLAEQQGGATGWGR